MLFSDWQVSSSTSAFELDHGWVSTWVKMASKWVYMCASPPLFPLNSCNDHRPPLTVRLWRLRVSATRLLSLPASPLRRWVCELLYLWSVVAPALMPNRDFGYSA